MRAILLVSTALLGAACGDSEPAAPAPKAEAPAAKAAPSCTYTAQAAGSSAKWTAYKFTEKAGVGGGFDKLSVEGAKPADSAWKAIDGLKFAIETASVNSNNPDRDKKITEQFFGTMADTAQLTGALKATSADAGTLTVTMNGATHEVPVKLATGEGDTLTLTGTLDVETWGGGPAIAALNKVCEDLHKGKDGVSKLWPTVDVVGTVSLQKTCK